MRITQRYGASPRIEHNKWTHCPYFWNQFLHLNADAPYTLNPFVLALTLWTSLVRLFQINRSSFSISRPIYSNYNQDRGNGLQKQNPNRGAVGACEKGFYSFGQTRYFHAPRKTIGLYVLQK